MSRLPSFIYAGAAKAGSMWIDAALREHPEIFLPVVKRTFFFDRNFQSGLEWYKSHFQGSEGYKAAGEICHDYFLDPAAAQRIKDHIPGAKVIFCLREPADRLVSAYLHEREHGNIGDQSFEEFIANDDVLQKSRYLENLKPYLDIFPRDQILVLFYEDLRDDPAAFYSKMCKFIGVDPCYQAKTITHRVNPTRRVRFPSVAKRIYTRSRSKSTTAHSASFKNKLRRRLLTWLAPVLYSKEKPEITVDPVVIQRLRDGFSGSYAELERSLGIKLPPGW